MVGKNSIHKRKLKQDLGKSVILAQKSISAKKKKASCFLFDSSTVAKRCTKHSFTQKEFRTEAKRL